MLFILCLCFITAQWLPISYISYIELLIRNIICYILYMLIVRGKIIKEWKKINAIYDLH